MQGPADLEAEWQTQSVRDTALARRKELLRLELLEREAWSAWDRSKEPAQTAVVTGETGKQQTRRSVKHQHGDPRFLAQISQCVQTRWRAVGARRADQGGADQSPRGDERDPEATTYPRSTTSARRSLACSKRHWKSNNVLPPKRTMKAATTDLWIRDRKLCLAIQARGARETLWAGDPARLGFGTPLAGHGPG